MVACQAKQDGFYHRLMPELAKRSPPVAHLPVSDPAQNKSISPVPLDPLGFIIRAQEAIRPPVTGSSINNNGNTMYKCALKRHPCDWWWLQG